MRRTIACFKSSPIPFSCAYLIQNRSIDFVLDKNKEEKLDTNNHRKLWCIDNKESWTIIKDSPRYNDILWENSFYKCYEGVVDKEASKVCQ